VFGEDGHANFPPPTINLGLQKYVAGLSFIIQNEKEVVRKFDYCLNHFSMEKGDSHEHLRFKLIYQC
jgi:hypothetical protein